ncbi:transmembrane 208-like [Chlorella sorokiniana]|uniref:Transmembrane 208-like n=1 Tax=Chlorella sorokiniana TaxID=3076 RepID=A0A2P6U1V3_CHLSO|nr:transmembrane 208-like [Chlorella sorokiniana]|eukprot:PRW60298.1 transmembrane 208-like [Chlorella sorokiniana]
MAKGGDKKRVEQNSAHLRKLQLLIAGANVAFVLIRLIWRGATAGKALYAGLLLTTVLYAVCYRSIASALAPVYGAGGELIFSGQDLSIGGALEYFHDVLYICIFVQVLGCYTDKAWWTFLLIPAFAGYQLMVHVVLPWWNTPKLDDAPETDAERKRREKRERQEARMAKFRR